MHSPVVKCGLLLLRCESRWSHVISPQAALRAEAAALESFIPVIVEGARSGMQQALAKQVRPASWTHLSRSPMSGRQIPPASNTRGHALYSPIWQLCDFG